MSYTPYKPRRMALDIEGILNIINDGRLDTVVITCMLNSEGRNALEKFLKNYVVDRYGIDKLLEWTRQAESLLRRKSSLINTPALLVPGNQTTTGQDEGMYVKFEYFCWWVEPKDDKTSVHQHDKQANRRVIDKQIAEREEEQKSLPVGYKPV